MRVVFCGTGWAAIVEEIRRHLPPGATLRVRDPGRPLPAELADADVLLPSNCRLDAATLAALPHLRLIQQPAAGYEKIDLVAAAALGVPVCNAPGVNAQAVAEAALLLILALARRLPVARRAFLEARIGEPAGIELGGKTLGIVGLGRSGSRLARAAEALGMDVVAVRSSSSREDFQDLLARADVISIHCPVTPETRGLFGDATFAAMKPGALLVNCSRGAVIEKAALEAALASGRLGGVGLDVYWEEPWDPADPLFARDDVVTLPHVGGSTREAFTRMAVLVGENIGRVMRGEAPLYRVG